MDIKTGDISRLEGLFGASADDSARKQQPPITGMLYAAAG
jgi:hypothetical protein